MDLKNAVAIVTGGNGGLGQRICHALAAVGANIAVVYAQSENEAGKVADDLRKHGVEAEPFQCDLTKPAQIQRLVDDVVKRFGRVDILINDAAYNKAIPFKDLDALTTVNIASIAGLGPSGSSIAYAVSKAGLIHLTRCMAIALAPEVLVNCVAPGLLEGTRSTANLAQTQIDHANSAALLKRAADKDDVADQVVTMCRAETMTGQTIAIDAGRVFH
jgi:3-oxoacyl-[acyl-carrier protein] reductase